MSKDIETVVTDAPAKTGSHLIEADPYLVAFSLSNPRRRRGLDIASLNALASSIKAQGLAQPILVRPLPGSRAEDTFAAREDGRPLPAYELVCGERRLRASRIAELTEIPMLVRDLDDEAALELQLVENIEREDLDPMEEAEGFELLRNKLGYTIEQIADRIGKGKGSSYIYKTMKLLALTPESREAMYDGHLGRSTGLLVARYPAAQQAAVVAYIKTLGSKSEPAPYRIVAPQVFRRFNLDLAKAVWPIADADLVSTAGACTACPKRSGAHADLFGDEEGSPDSCTDPDCFESKRAAHIERVKAQAAKDGFKVIDGDEAKQAIPSPHSHYMHGYSRLTDTAYTETGDDGEEREVTFEDALRAKGKKAPKPRVLIHPHTGEAIKVITRELADKLQPEDAGAAAKGRRHEKEPDDRPEEIQALDDYHTRRAVLLRIFDSIRNRDRTDGDMLMIARAFFVSTLDEPLDELEIYLSWDDLADAADPGVALQQKLEAMPAAELAAVLTMGCAATIFERYGFTKEQQLAVATTYGIDVVAVRDKVAEDLQRQESGEAGEDEGATPFDTPPEGDAAPAEPEPYFGARVRMKDNLRGAGGKTRKISGREGVLQQHVDCDTWMVKCDGSKEKTRVERDEFVVLPAAEAEADPAGTVQVETVETPSWPFPVAKKTAAVKDLLAAKRVEAQLEPQGAWPFPKAKDQHQGEAG